MASSLVVGGGSGEGRGEKRGGGGGGCGAEGRGGAGHGGGGVGGSGKGQGGDGGGYGGGVCQMLLRILLLSSCLPNLLIIPASGQRSVQCVQIGQWEESGPFTIGAEMFRVKDRGPMRFAYDDLPQDFSGQGARGSLHRDTVWPFKPACPEGFTPVHTLTASLQFCTADDEIEIRTYLVKEGDRVLKGWLHFEVESKKDEMQYIYAQVRDEVFNAIGEFVSEEKDQCNSTSKELISPTKYQFLPCSATGQREAKTSQAIFVAKPSQYVKPPPKGFITSKELKRGIHFTWRLDEYWCNRHEKLRLDVHVWTTKSHQTYRSTQNNGKNLGNQERCNVPAYNKGCLLKRKISNHWIYPGWFGAADIRTLGQLNCTVEAINRKNGNPNTAGSSWLKKATRVLVNEDYFGPDQLYLPKVPGIGHVYKSCQFTIKPRGTTGAASKDFVRLKSGVETFGGRCEDHYKLSASRHYYHKCENDTNAPEFALADVSSFDNYSNYLNTLNYNRLLQCNQTCEEPSSAKDLEDIKSFPKSTKSQNKTKPAIHFETLTGSRVAVRATTFWQTRKFHGNVCIFFTMFLLPVSNLLIRYYKETFMNHLSLGCAPWFWFHMFVCFAVPTLYRSGYSAMEQNIQNFGRSKDGYAEVHRYLGRGFIWVFCIMVCIGGFRLVSRRARLVCMAMHSVMGFVLYLVALILIGTSTYIPSSPSLDSCRPGTGLPQGFSFTAKLALSWFVIDFVFHVILTVMQFAIDRRYGIKRFGFGLPFIPILPADGRNDLVGSRLRKLLFLIYVGLSLGFTVATMAELFAKDLDKDGLIERLRHCTLGEMTCDLNQVLPNKPSSPFGCAAFSLKYYAVVYSKYKVNFTRTV